MNRVPLRLAIACFAVAALAKPAQAVLAPEYYEEARRGAANHLQIQVEDVDGPGGGMGDCMVEGIVARVFRGDIMPERKLVFAVSCYDYGDMPSGGTLWTDYDALKEAKYLEAFMSGDPEPKILLDQVEIIVAPRDVPYCDSNSLYCESAVDSAAKEEPCSFVGQVWHWLGIGAEECAGS